MKQISFLGLFCLLLVACGKESPLLNQCSLSVAILSCSAIDCVEKSPLSDVAIHFYNSKEDARLETNSQFSLITNSDGIATTSGIACQEYFIRVNSDDFGSYITRIISIVGSTKTIELSFVDNYFYDESDQAIMRQDHISFLYPRVGQVSKYLFYQYYGPSFSVPSYMDDTLKVRIIDKIDVNSYVVEEYSSGFLPSFLDLDSIETNTWRFENDSLYISKHESTFFNGSYIAHLSSWTEDHGHQFALFPIDSNYFNLATETFFDIDFYGHGYTDDYTILNHTFTNLLLSPRSYMHLDGPTKLNCYNLNDGFVRSMSLSFWSGEVTGMDLILE